MLLGPLIPCTRDYLFEEDILRYLLTSLWERSKWDRDRYGRQLYSELLSIGDSAKSEKINQYLTIIHSQIN